MNRSWVLLVLAAWLVLAAQPATAQPTFSERLSAAEVQEKLSELQIIQTRNEERVLRIPGVLGIGIGVNRDQNDLCFIVYAEKITDRIRSRLAAGIEKIPVRLVESGEIRAF